MITIEVILIVLAIWATVFVPIAAFIIWSSRLVKIDHTEQDYYTGDNYADLGSDRD